MLRADTGAGLPFAATAIVPGKGWGPRILNRIVSSDCEIDRLLHIRNTAHRKGDFIASSCGSGQGNEDIHGDCDGLAGTNGDAEGKLNLWLLEEYWDDKGGVSNSTERH